MQALSGAVGFCCPWIAASGEMATPPKPTTAPDAGEPLHWITYKVKPFEVCEASISDCICSGMAKLQEAIDLVCT